jgi:hypothetical protein
MAAGDGQDAADGVGQREMMAGQASARTRHLTGRLRAPGSGREGWVSVEVEMEVLVIGERQG